jgi:hypothetical protein
MYSIQSPVISRNKTLSHEASWSVWGLITLNVAYCGKGKKPPSRQYGSTRVSTLSASRH